MLYFVFPLCARVGAIILDEHKDIRERFDEMLYALSSKSIKDVVLEE